MNLLLTGCFKYSEEQKEKLTSLGYTIYFLQQENDAIDFPVADIDAAVCNGLFLNHNIEDFINLKFIQLTSAGFDRIPIDKIKNRGIELYNARGVYSRPMAEWVIFRVLEYYKQGWFFKEKQENCLWEKHRGLLEISGKNVAVIGAGNIGQEVAKLFQAFDACTTGFDIHTNSTLGFDNMVLTEKLKDMVGEFDIIVITAPLLPSTKRLINKEILLKMKHNAVLINISRGGLIDEQALIHILQQRNDIFVALDVFESEPLSEKSPLWKLKNIALSPHNSFVSDRNNSRMFQVIYNNLKNFILKN